MDSPLMRTESPTPLGSLSQFSQTKPIYPTRCIHTISQEDRNSVLSLVTSQRYLFSGSQSSQIHVWDLQTFTLVTVLRGHKGSVLGLTLSEDEKYLFSSSSDGTVRVWNTETLKCAYLIQSCHDVGDVFSICYSDLNHMVYFGSQNTSIQWYNLTDAQTHGVSVDKTTITRRCKSQVINFFDKDESADDEKERLLQQELDRDVIKCIVREKNICNNAHNGYVYCLLYATDIPNVDGEVLISGSGDGDVKIWSIKESGIELIHTLSGNPDKGILCLALSEDGYLFCGVQGGDIQIWDLETFQMIRSVMAHNDDVLAVSIKSPGFVSASADGTIKIWSEGFLLTESLVEHQGIVLSLATSGNYLISGSNDHTIKFWDMPLPVQTGFEPFRRKSTTISETPTSDTMLYVLEKWIAMRTVSGDPRYMEECRRGARFLKNVFQQLGAVSRMIPGASGRNPLVYGKFTGKRNNPSNDAKKVPTVLIYGHYDVISAENENKLWGSPPFNLTGKNGYLYGRGVSDNKGPILACVFAVNELLKQGQLDVNVIFLIEGEEESGSVGFYEAVTESAELFQDVDMILLSNSYWLGEDVPCITYGLRGVIHATIAISNKRADLHSGVEGGAVSEPLMDLIHVLGKLVDDEQNKVLIPGFYDHVRPLTPSEEKLYDPIVEWMRTSKVPAAATAPAHNHSKRATAPHQQPNVGSPILGKQSLNQVDHPQQIKQQLMSRWRYPTLTVHKIDVSINNPTIIPRSAKAAVSMRVVPDQDISDICKQFEHYVHSVFSKSTHSDNTISVIIESAAEYWLGDLNSKYFKAVERAIQDEWQMKPLYIREGGSIPAVRWLEKFCNAPAVHIPFGQSSDQAHLHNERIRLLNLHAGRRIIKTLLSDIPHL
ncbi:WD40-repeat-containing domain protein [Mycotypha africana]|uniref:WD40-repeat-containing domain protein n=1 Tax=Mycotypha africana TaxID=64632 RepID=UPI0023019395|nr:WD40-repeat-containing domain protein [Mycotypha africana]KAI8977252.1 WD40-repeat-containing domain protein [Mycotypha africana]